MTRQKSQWTEDGRSYRNRPLGSPADMFLNQTDRCFASEANGPTANNDPREGAHTGTRTCLSPEQDGTNSVKTQKHFNNLRSSALLLPPASKLAAVRAASAS